MASSDHQKHTEIQQVMLLSSLITKIVAEKDDDVFLQTMWISLIVVLTVVTIMPSQHGSELLLEFCCFDKFIKIERKSIYQYLNLYRAGTQAPKTIRRTKVTFVIADSYQAVQVCCCTLYHGPFASAKRIVEKKGMQVCL